MTLFLTAFLLTICSGAQAQDRPPHPPPPEAIEACATLTEGAVCSFEGRRGETVEGECVLTPEDELACAPAGGPPPRR